MRHDRFQGVGAARRVEPATSRQRRAYPTTVRDDRRGHDPGSRVAGWAAGDRRQARVPVSPSRRSGHRPGRLSPRRGPGIRAALRRSRATPQDPRAVGQRTVPAPPGRTRTTRAVPAGSRSSRSRTRCRSRRRTLLRLTRCRRPWTRQSRHGPALASGRGRLGAGSHRDRTTGFRPRSEANMGDQQPTPGPAASANRCGELSAPPHSACGRQHHAPRRGRSVGLRPRGGHGPAAGAR